MTKCTLGWKSRYLCTCNITILHMILVDIFVDLEMETSLLAKVDVFSVKR
jgi:hypothetical protein